METPLAGWTNFFEESKTCLCATDSDSVQSFLNRLLEKYGDGDLRLSKDLIQSGELQQPISKTKWNYNQFDAWCQLIAERGLDWLVCCIICSQWIMLGDSKANAKYIRCTRENQLAYRLFVPHNENVLSHGRWLVHSNWKLVEGQHIQLVELLKFQVLP